MCLGGQTCGNTYGSCIDDSPESLNIYVIIIVIISAVGVIASALGGCVYYCQIRKRKQARIHVARPIRDITTQSQGQHIYYINPNPSIAVQTPIQRTSPPTYEQVVPKTIRN
jgi:hypothetical protein